MRANPAIAAPALPAGTVLDSRGAPLAEQLVAIDRFTGQHLALARMALDAGLGPSLDVAKLSALSLGRSVYHAAQDTRFRQFTGDGPFTLGRLQTEDEMLPAYDRAIIITRARIMFRNHPHLAAILQSYVQEIGTPTYKSQTGDKRYDDLKERILLNWASECESENLLSLDEVVEIRNFEDCIGGELFIVALRTGKLQLIPTELCGSHKNGVHTFTAATQFDDGTPIPAGSTERDGLIRDPNRTIIGYRFGQRSATRFDSVSFAPESSSLIAARFVWHLYDPDRVEMGRGVPKVAPILPVLQDIFDTANARAQQVKNAACLSMWITKNIDPNGYAEAMRGALNRGAVEDAAALKTLASTRSNYQDIRAGAVYYGATGEDLKLIEPKLDSKGFHEHYIDMLQVCCACLNGMPVEIGIEGFRASNYSGGRATVNKWKRNVKRRRKRDEAKWLDGVITWQTRRAELFSNLPPPPAGPGGRDGRWGWPAIPDIDGAKTAATNAMELANGTTTRTAIYADKGEHIDIEDRIFAEEKARLLKLLMEQGKAAGLNDTEARAFALSQMPTPNGALLVPLVTASLAPDSAPASAR